MAQLLLSWTQQLYCVCSDGLYGARVGWMYSCISRLRKLIALGNWREGILPTSTFQSLFSGLLFLFPGLCLLLMSQSPMSRTYDPEWKDGVKISTFTHSFLQPVMLSWETYLDILTDMQIVFFKVSCIRNVVSDQRTTQKKNILSNSLNMFTRTAHLKIVRQSRWHVALCDLFVFFL